MKNVLACWYEVVDVIKGCMFEPWLEQWHFNFFFPIFLKISVEYERLKVDSLNMVTCTMFKTN